MIDKYGADAFRFTLAAFTAQGRDVRMSEERIEGYKFFINKIWNATRFTMMNLDGYAGKYDQPGEGSGLLPDRWIRARLNRTIDDINRHLDAYRFNEAAASIYQFIWHEFCDWYLELIKPVLYGKEEEGKKEAVLQTLYMVLKASLQLLHPFMPFLTEEIWQKCIHDGTSVMVSNFPKPEDAAKDMSAEKEMSLLMEVITKIRNIRGEMNVLPSRKITVTISAPDPGIKTLMNRDRNYIINLANLEALTIAGDMDEPKGVATGVVGAMRIFVFLEGVVDISAEKLRLQKEMAKMEKDLKQVANKLANQDFIKKAAPAVIEKEELKYKTLRDKFTILENLYQKFEEIKD